jgi:PleD family two-component response regulator
LCDSVPQGQTVSIGVSERRPGESVSTWYGRTDRALYRAKESGRNKVVVDREDEPVSA